MPHHAIDIALTRPATVAEIKTAARTSRYPLAVDTARTRLLVLVPAKAPRRALRKLRGTLDGLLPIDTLSTLYPDAQGQHLLNVELNPQTHKTLQRAAARCGQRPEDYLKDAVLDAVTRDRAAARARLDTALDRFLASSTPAQLLGAVAQRLT